MALAPPAPVPRGTGWLLRDLPGCPRGPRPSAPPSRTATWRPTRAARDQPAQVLVCTNKACRKSGSLQVAEYLKCLAPPAVDVVTTGCLGKCGNGPNLVVLPEELHVSHCSTAAHVARLLEKQCGAADAATNLRAFELQASGTQAFTQGRFQEAEDLFSQAIDLSPSGGLHYILCSRAACRTSQGNAQGALEDVRAAAKLKPNWSTCMIREAQAYEVAGDPEKALSIYEKTADIDPEFRRSKLYMRKRKELQPQPQPAAV